MKQTLLQSLLVATGLFAGTCTAFADETTLSPTQTTQIKGGDDADNVFYDAEATSWTCSQSKVSGSAFSGPSGSNYPGPVVLTKFDASSTLEGKLLKKATLVFTSVCTVKGKNSNVQVAQVGTGWDAATATWANTNTGDVLGAVNIDETKNGVNVKTSAKTLTLNVTEYLNNSADKTIGFGIYTYTAREQKLTDIKLQLEYVSASSSAGYTIKYVDAEGNELKDAKTDTGEAGATVELADADKAAIYVDGRKYVYQSDDADAQTVASDGSTVVTVSFAEAEKYKYSLNAVNADGATLMTMTEGEAYAGDNVTVAYMAYYLDEDGSLLQAGKKDNGKEYNYTFAVEEPDQVFTITYNPTDVKDVYFLSECEDISGMEIINTGNSAIRSSMSACGYAKDGDVRICTLAPGKYKITSVACDFAGREASAVFNYKVNDEVVFKHTVANINWDEQTSDEFEVTSTTSLFLEQTSNSKQGIDLVYIVKTGDVTTGIDDVKAADAADTEIYNVQGIRLAKPAKGLNIINGKKVIVK